MFDYQQIYHLIPIIFHYINGNSRILKWGYCTILLAIFCGDIPLHRPYIDHIYIYNIYIYIS